MKIFNKFEKKENLPDSFKGLTETDKIELLAVMCLDCNPFFVRGNLVQFVCSEYVLQDRDDVDLARQLFISSGINVKLRHMQWNRFLNASVLRSKMYINFNNPNFEKNASFMRQVENTSQDLVKSENKDKWYELQDKLQSIRNDFNRHSIQK